MRNFILLLSLIILLLGCACSNTTNYAGTIAVPQNVVAEESPATPYDVYVTDKNYKLSLYEPQKGAYLGAYVLSNKKINFDIEYFETLANKKHGVYIYNMKLGEAFPFDWILSCIATMKTPYIIVHPPNDYMPFQSNLLDDAAKEFGELYVPIFVQFYPNPQFKNYDSQEYINFFKKARESFKEYASNVSFVWSADEENVYNCLNYYPGDEYTDWVGLNIYETIQDKENTYKRDIFKEIDYFYYLFQKSKPMMISQLGISHYTSKDHTYYIKEAGAELVSVYDKIREEYPRIKAINYMDFNNIDLSPEGTVRDNFSITDDEDVLENYKKAIENNYFLSEVSIRDSGSVNSELMRSPFKAYKKNNELYISYKTVFYDCNFKNTDLLKPFEVVMDDKVYYALSDIAGTLNLKFTEDEANKKIVLNN